MHGDVQIRRERASFLRSPPAPSSFYTHILDIVVLVRVSPGIMSLMVAMRGGVRCIQVTNVVRLLCTDWKEGAFPMMLVSYRTRGSDAAWHAGIAHEGTVVDVAASRLHRADKAQGPGDLSVRGLLEQGPSFVEEVFAWAKPQFEA